MSVPILWWHRHCNHIPFNRMLSPSYSDINVPIQWWHKLCTHIPFNRMLSVSYGDMVTQILYIQLFILPMFSILYASNLGLYSYWFSRKWVSMAQNTGLHCYRLVHWTKGFICIVLTLISEDVSILYSYSALRYYLACDSSRIIIFFKCIFLI